MKTTLLALTLSVLALGCGGALGVPGEDAPGCGGVELTQSDLNPCAYVLPEGTCGELAVYVDGEPQPAHTLKVFCYEGLVFIPSDAAGLCPLREVFLCAE